MPLRPSADAPALRYAGVHALVLGATGFLGRHVARALAAGGASVVIVARRREAADVLCRELGDHAGVSITDLARDGGVESVLHYHRPDVVFNLAVHGVDPAERDAALATRLNTEVPAQLVAAMATTPRRSWPGQHVIHAGSALEYGAAGGDLREETTCAPTTLYGGTKLRGTMRLLDAASRMGVRACAARLFTVYGPGERPGRLLPTLLAAARTTAPIPLSVGAQRRDFTFVDDAVEGLLRLGALTAPDLGVVNVATGRLTPVRDFATTAAAVLGIAPARLSFGALPARAEEMRHDPVSIRRLTDLAGWAPAVTIRDGIERSRDARG